MTTTPPTQSKTCPLQRALGAEHLQRRALARRDQCCSATVLLRGDVIDLDDVVHGLIGIVGEALAGGLLAIAGEDAVGDAQSFHGQSKPTGFG